MKRRRRAKERGKSGLGQGRNGGPRGREERKEGGKGRELSNVTENYNL